MVRARTTAAAITLALTAGVCTYARGDENRSAAVDPEEAGEPPSLEATSTRACSTEGYTTWYREPLPTRGLTIEGTLFALAGATTGGFGVGLEGATALETRTFLEGLETTDVRFGGLSGTRYFRELFDEMHVTGGRVELKTHSVIRRTRGALVAYLAPGFASADTEVGLRDRVIAGRRKPVFDAAVGGRVGARISPGTTISVSTMYRGVREDLHRFVRRQTDVDQNGLPDRDESGRRVLEIVDRSRLEDTWDEFQGMMRADLSPAVAHEGTVVLGVIHGTELDNGISGAPPAMSETRSELTTDLAARWQWKPSEAVAVRAFGGWHRNAIEDRPIDAAHADAPRVDLHSYNLAWLSQLGHESMDAATGCTDSNDPALDPYPFIENCPLDRAYSIGGPGHLRDDTSGRATGGFEIGRTLGDHELGARVAGTRRYAHVSHAVSGGERVQQTPYTITRTRPVEQSTGVYADAVSAAVQDQWRPIDGALVRAKLQLDRETLVGTSQRLPLLSISPTLFGSYRPGDDAPWLVFGEIGWHSDPVPLELALSKMSNRRTRYLSCNGSLGIPCSEEPEITSVAFPARIDGPLSPPTTDDAVIGFSTQPVDALELGATYTNRSLSSALEDVYAGAQPVLTNPDAERVYRGLETFAHLNLSDDLVVRARYVVSRTAGNYEGPISSHNFQLAPHTTTAFDSAEVTVNDSGLLPQDRPHRLHLETWGRAELGRHEIGAGTRVRVESGMPMNALGRHEALGHREVFLMPRGGFGRTESRREVDVQLAYTYRNLQHGAVEVFLDLFNVLNAQHARVIDEAYTHDATIGIDGASYGDLVFAKRHDDPAPVRRNPKFGETLVKDAPLSARLGVRLRF